MLGWTLARMSMASRTIVPVCSRHARTEPTRDWLRINVEDPTDWTVLTERAPKTLLYCAGVCDVKRCDANPEFAWAVNHGGVQAMLDALPDDTRLVVCSSDHVFAGRKAAYVESTPTEPISVYGRTRVASEALVAHRRPDALIVRVALTIGPSLNGRTGHMDWLRYRHKRGLAMTIIEDEHRAAVWASDAGQRIMALADSDTAGIRHLAATRCSARPELAAHLCEQLDIDPAFHTAPRSDLNHPHLGHIDLQTEHSDALSRPLRAVVDTPHSA